MTVEGSEGARTRGVSSLTQQERTPRPMGVFCLLFTEAMLTAYDAARAPG